MAAISVRAVDYFRGVQEGGPSKGAIAEVLAVLASGADDPLECAAIADQHGVTDENWYRRDCVDLVLGYVKHVVEDAHLDADAQRDVALLKARLQVAPGEFISHRAIEVSRVLQEQFELLLADGHIDSSEDLYQVDLQAMFDLGYDDYLALIRSVLEVHWHRMRRDLTTARLRGSASAKDLELKTRALEPLYRLAAGMARVNDPADVEPDRSDA